MRIATGVAALAAALCFIIPAGAVDQDKLNRVIADRMEEDKVRDQYRHPAETLAFFGIEPGMTVVDALPGSWYGRIFVNYLGSNGHYVGTRYSLDLYKKIYGDRFEERKDRIDAWPGDFTSMAKEMDANIDASFFHMGDAPENLKGTVDAYVYFRALHHLNRIEPHYLEDSAKEAFDLVKPGGIIGIVQHRAPETSASGWANGSNGYLKMSRAIEAFTKAGFVLEATSEINANPKDQPTEEDFVWRLPPSYEFGDENREKYAAIGESNRMTLRFRKPE